MIVRWDGDQGDSKVGWGRGVVKWERDWDNSKL